MFRLIPHHAFIEPRVQIASVEPGADGINVTLRVEGLLCSACAANVRGRLERVAGVRSARVDLERGEALVEYERPDDLEALTRAAEGAIILRPVRRMLASIAGHRRGAV